MAISVPIAFLPALFPARELYWIPRTDSMNDEYALKASAFLSRIEALPDGGDVEWAAERLELMHWTPELLKSVGGFLRISKKTLADEVRSTLDADDAETVTMFPGVSLEPPRARITQASLLVSAAELLWRLRADEPEAWDQVNELYEDD